MNNFFSDAVLDLDIDRTLHVDYETNANTPVEKAIEKFKKHPSILKKSSRNILVFSRKVQETS